MAPDDFVRGQDAGAVVLAEWNRFHAAGAVTIEQAKQIAGAFADAPVEDVSAALETATDIWREHVQQDALPSSKPDFEITAAMTLLIHLSSFRYDRFAGIEQSKRPA